MVRLLTMQDELNKQLNATAAAAAAVVAAAALPLPPLPGSKMPTAHPTAALAAPPALYVPPGVSASSLAMAVAAAAATATATGSTANGTTAAVITPRRIAA